jgi:hypothetical protein
MIHPKITTIFLEVDELLKRKNQLLQEHYSTRIKKTRTKILKFKFRNTSEGLSTRKINSQIDRLDREKKNQINNNLKQ